MSQGLFQELARSVSNLVGMKEIKGSLEAQMKLNPIRLMTDHSSFPVATKDYANLVGVEVGSPFLPNKPSPQGQQERMREELRKGGFLAE